jgi:hypothetical protein
LSGFFGQQKPVWKTDKVEQLTGFFWSGSVGPVETSENQFFLPNRTGRSSRKPAGSHRYLKPSYGVHVCRSGETSVPLARHGKKLLYITREKDIRGLIRPSTLVLLHLLIQNGIFHPTHPYSLLYTYFSRIHHPSYFSFIPTTGPTHLFYHLPPSPPPPRLYPLRSPHQPTHRTLAAVRGWGTVALPRGGRPAPSRRQELRTRRRGDAAAPAPAGHPRRLPGGALCSSLAAPQPGRVSPRR